MKREIANTNDFKQQKHLKVVYTIYHVSLGAFKCVALHFS